MNNLAHNNLIRFLSITKKKTGLFANFKVKGLKGGTQYTASITVDMAAAEVDLTDPLEKIISQCAKIAVREVKTSDLQFEGIIAV